MLRIQYVSFKQHYVGAEATYKCRNDSLTIDIDGTYGQTEFTAMCTQYGEIPPWWTTLGHLGAVSYTHLTLPTTPYV